MDFYDSSKGSFIGLLLRVLQNNLRHIAYAKIHSSDGLDHALSLDEEIGDDITLHDVIGDDYETNPSLYFEMKELMIKTKTNGSPLARRVVRLRFSGRTYKEISDKMDIHVSRVRRLFEKSKKKSFGDLTIKIK